MSAITLDGSLMDRLNGVKPGTELRDPAGKPLGYVVSPEDYRRLQYARALERHTIEEVECMRRQPGGRPLADIWRDLGAG